MQMNIIVKMLIFFMQFGSNIATGPIRRIIGGQQAPITKFPFLVSIQMFGQHSCGGSIVAPSFVVSAAHCFGMTRDPKVFKIRAGSGYRNYSGKLVPVQSITLHKDYVVSNSDRSNDISLLKLFQSLLYSNRIKAIAIIDPNTDVKDDTEVTVSGWGDIAYSSKIVETNVLMTATFETINFNLCKKNYAAINYKVTLKMLCAGKITGGKDSCHGDSGIYNKSKFISLLIGCSVGGPLTMQTNGAPVLIGVVSFGKDCAKENFPGVYTKISVYNKWIKSRLN